MAEAEREKEVTGGVEREWKERERQREGSDRRGRERAHAFLHM